MLHADLPAHGSIVSGSGRFFFVSIPLPPVTRIRLVEMPVHNGPVPSKVLSVDPEKLCLAISRGVLTIVKLQSAVLPGPIAAASAHPRPYPLEVAREAARKRRRLLWNRPDVVSLCRRGLLMTGAEYARRRARRLPPASSPTCDGGAD